MRLMPGSTNLGVWKLRDDCQLPLLTLQSLSYSPFRYQQFYRGCVAIAGKGELHPEGLRAGREGVPSELERGGSGALLLELS